jgi:hypothetical protein
MHTIVRSIGHLGCSRSSSPTQFRRVALSVTTGSQTLHQQPINASLQTSVFCRRWHQQTRSSSSDHKDKALDRHGSSKNQSKSNDDIEAEQEKQVRAPWHREGAEQPPVSRPRSAGAMTKGRILASFRGKGLTVCREASDHSVQTTEAYIALDDP